MDWTKMSLLRWWFLIVLLLFNDLGVNGPLQAEAFTLENYFKILAMAARKRDMWRKIFGGSDIGFDASPWLFKDRVMPPYVPIIKTFPKYPVQGHYRDERAPTSPPVSFPQFYSNLQLSHRLPPPPKVYYRSDYARSMRGRNSRPWRARRGRLYSGGGRGS
ncbi:uncharacterized protein [Macrobrachium rosenbergii]|uniref:uncharacterized protein n=1 Tax=Macrobrachium rosenbergii TaxID=79674 RepID=UPI0034D781AA